jgi:hypothetical protein
LVPLQVGLALVPLHLLMPHSRSWFSIQPSLQTLAFDSLHLPPLAFSQRASSGLRVQHLLEKNFHHHFAGGGHSLEKTLPSALPLRLQPLD